MFGCGEGSPEKVWSVGESCKALYSEDGHFYKATIRKLTRKPEGVTATVHFDGYCSEETEEVDISYLKKLTRKKVAQPDVSIIEAPGPNDSLFSPLCGREETSWLHDKYADLDDEDEDDPGGGARRSKGVVAVGGASITRKVRRSKVKQKSSQSPNKHATPAMNGGEVKRSTVTSGSQGNSSLQPGSSKEDGSALMGKFSLRPGPSKESIPDGRVKSSPRPGPSKESIPDGREKSSPRPGLSKEGVPVGRADRISAGLWGSDDEEEEADISRDRGCDGFDEEDLEKPRFSFTPASAKIPYQLSDVSDTHTVEVPATINQYLRDYQRDGIKFMYSHYSQDRGAILGDDMGLGKTVQVIGLLCALLYKKGNKVDVHRQKPKFIRQMSDMPSLPDTGAPKHGPFLIIGPGSVLYNWLDELEVWGYFTVGKYHATEKVQCLADAQREKYEVVVTTYETFRDNVRDLNTIPWDAVFVDEVHRIKGLKAQTTQALRQVKTLRRFGLTGTALQNNIEELWSLLDWAQPGCLGSLMDFKEEFVDPIEKGQKLTSTKRELAYARKKNQEFAKMRSKMLLRRTKAIITDQLPKKDDSVVFCKLTDIQTSMYRAVLSHPGMRFVLSMDEPCECGSDVIKGRCHNKTPAGMSTRQLRFTYMHILLKIANHVALLVPANKSNQNLTEFTKEVVKYIFDKFPEYFSDTREAAFRTLSDPQYCGKMKVLKGLLSVFYRDHSKVLLFSYSTKVLDILEQYVMTTEYEYRRLDGSTSSKKRLHLVREFNKDPHIFLFLISTKAGGLGLNLTGANRVVIFDPNWNPTHDLQAQDRAYRIGQRRNVQVYRLISAGSIEENMYLRQVYKQQLDSVAVGTTNAKRYFNAVPGDSEQKGELFGVKNMFRLHTGEKCLTMNILQRNTNLETGLTAYNVAKYIPPVKLPRETGGDHSDQEDSGDESADRSGGEEDTGGDIAHYFDLRDTTADEDSLDIEDDIVVFPKAKPTRKSKPRSRDLASTATGQFDSVDGDVPGQPRTPGPSFSSVGAVFDNCGVLHVHENRKVIGGSKAEDHMTKCAIQDVYELHQNSQEPAAYCNPYSDSSPDEETPPPKARGRGKKRSISNPNSSRVEVIGNTKVLIGQTPRAIRQQQFQQMSGAESLVDFAQSVLMGDANTRRGILRDFYVSENPDLSKIFCESPTAPYTDSSEKPVPRNSRKSKKTPRARRMKDNSTLGITYMSDSESIEAKITRTTSRESNRSAGLDVGRKVTPRRSRVAMTTRTRVKSSMNVGRSATVQRSGQNSGGKSGKMSGGYNTETEVTSLYNPAVEDMDKGEEEEEEKVRKTKKGPHYYDLLAEIGEKSTEIFNEQSEENEEECNNKTDVNLSVLDDIFLAEKKSSTTYRKPPPGKRKDKRPVMMASGSDVSMTTDADSMVTDREKEGDLLCNSTLKDDSFDCFTDPLKWKKRKRKVQETGVDRLISEGDEDFLSLFESGKMRKRDRTKDYTRVEIRDDGKSVESCDKTPSLF